MEAAIGAAPSRVGDWYSPTVVLTSDRNLSVVFWKKPNKEEHRYYLLPGMARSHRRRHAETLRWSLLVGIIASVLIGVAVYYSNRY